MVPELRFTVLGPVRAWRGEAEIPIGSPQQRAVLAVLLLAEGRQVALATLVDALWGDDPPLAAGGTIRTYVSRLRRCLPAMADGAGATGAVIGSAGDGYQLRPGGVTLDLALFQRWTAQARTAEGPAAAALFRDALGLWQGVPLAGIPGGYAQGQRVRLAELHMAAIEDRLALDIELGGHVGAAAELAGLLAAHPLRERLSELLMLALYRSGRQAHALEVFRAARRRLADDLGIDPGPGLRDMHQRILRMDPGLEPVNPRLPTGALAAGSGAGGSGAGGSGTGGSGAGRGWAGGSGAGGSGTDGSRAGGSGAGGGWAGGSGAGGSGTDGSGVGGSWAGGSGAGGSWAGGIAAERAAAGGVAAGSTAGGGLAAGNVGSAAAGGAPGGCVPAGYAPAGCAAGGGMGADSTAGVATAAAGALGSSAVRPLTPLVPPAQLPARPPGFTGREAELADLAATLVPPPTRAGAQAAAILAGPPVVIISGMPGIGKSALALHWAHQAAGQCRNGRFQVGQSEAGQPRDGQGRACQAWDGQGRACQPRDGQGRACQPWDGQGRACQAGAGQSGDGQSGDGQCRDTQFPDGQLYVNLRGHDPAAPAMRPSEALRGFLEALGVPAPLIPAGTDAQAALYRSVLATRRMLIVLDGARDAAQVRPLLPGTAGCSVIITSRTRLTELVASHAARPLQLSPLPAGQAREILARRLGRDRPVAEPEAVADIVRHCAGLPLALAGVAARAAEQPHARLEQIAAPLREAGSRLDTLGCGGAGVRAAFGASYRLLTAPAGRLFRLLSVTPAAGFSTAAAASLAGVPEDTARPLLRELSRASLIGECAPGTYRLHDLVRCYAGELSAALDTGPDRHAARERLAGHCPGAGRKAAAGCTATPAPALCPRPRAASRADVIAASTRR